MNFICFGLEVEWKSDFAVFLSMLIGIHLQTNSIAAYPLHLASHWNPEMWAVPSLSKSIVTCQRLLNSLETFILLYWCLNRVMQEETSEWYCALKNTAVLYYAITTVSWAFACQKTPPNYCAKKPPYSGTVNGN